MASIIVSRSSNALVDRAGNALVSLLTPPTPTPPPDPIFPPTDTVFNICVLNAESIRQAAYRAARDAFAGNYKQLQKQFTIADREYFKAVLVCARLFNRIAPNAEAALQDTTKQLET